jgi:preprotein translocase subunit SecA
MLKQIVNFLGGDPNKRELERLSRIVERINALEPEYEKLSMDALRAKTDEFRARLKASLEAGNSLQEALDELLPEAFAAVREASKRTIGLRPYDVQLIGGMVLHAGKIAEMRTGEGKTLVATLPLYLNALAGRGAHLVTVNDYLARRDARWMAPIYHALGLSVGVLQMAARTENGRKAFLVDLSVESPHEDQHQLRMVHRREAYQADITYGTNSEFGFDYLRDNLTMSLEERVQRGHYYAIVDEVDNILIDEARTPLIISGPAQDDSANYIRMAQVVRQLRPEDVEVNEKDRSVSLTELGEIHVEELLGEPLRDPERPEDITPQQARLMGYLEQALRAQYLFKRNKDYLVQGGKVIIIDEFTGRLMPGRRWSDGLHQAVEAKEGVKVEAENVTYATITIQNYFRMYEKLAGMSGTAQTEAEEFYKIYKLDVLPIPTNLEYLASRPNSPYIIIDAKDEQGYRYTYYAHRDDPQRRPVFWKRKDYPDVVYRTAEAKLRAITLEILHYHILGRPQLVGTTSVEHSEHLSSRLDADLLRRLMLVQILRDLYQEINKVEIAERSIPQLAPLNKPLEQLEVSEIRQLARSLNIPMSFNLEDPENIARLRRLLEVSPENEERMIRALQGGIPHQVLNARKHDEESRIIARAGAFGAVTIATNMAGRGVDIKLGGELDEEILGDTNRVLERAGYDAYNMTNLERRDALLRMKPEDYSIYEEQVRAFLQYMDEMEKVRELGGLHVIGSERHEARRIDNQLRGRSARQGDPGSSRFYLSLEDELMRLFGGQQVTGLLERLNIDESIPIESRLVGRLVEQSQERVEGSNFDVRKHLLEYDDVLNAQRKRIYEQRDRVFTKEDLSEDIEEMLRVELQQRIPQELNNPEGPWRLLAYLEDIQPPISWNDLRYPSFTMRLLIDEIERRKPAEGASVAHLRRVLLELAENAFAAEREHVMKSFNELLDKTAETIEEQRKERLDSLDAFFETLEDRLEGEQSVRPQELAEELLTLARLPGMRLSNEQVRWLTQDPQRLREAIEEMIDTYLLNFNASRMVAALERRVGESLNLRPGQLNGMDWNEIADTLEREAGALFDRIHERLFGPAGQITRDLDSALEKTDDYLTEPNQLLDLLSMMATGSRLVFDRKTHRQSLLQTTRLRWVYLAAQLLGEVSPQEITRQVLEHLEGAGEALQQIFGAVDAMVLQQNRVTLRQTDPRLHEYFKDALGEEEFEQVADLPLESLSGEQREIVESVLGWWRQNEIYRQLLLSAISELWVDYLTRVEALRVSIGLEAYAQRDPLVQYKARASEMFTTLLSEIRSAVILRMFNLRPRQASAAPVAEGALAQPAPAVSNTPAGSNDRGAKKKRHRH